jgi:hypothetical protein
MDPTGTPPTPPARPRCEGLAKRGVRCIAKPLEGKRFCCNHDPEGREQRRRDGAKSNIRQGDIGTELGELGGICRRAARIVQRVEKGNITAAKASTLVMSLRFLLQAVEARHERAKSAGEVHTGTGTIESLEKALG